MRVYDANSQIRAIQWDPTSENKLYMGTENGNIYSIEINPNGENDVICYDQVPGYVHAIAVCENGSNGSILVIAYGQNIGFVRDPFASNDYLGTLVLFPAEPFPNTQDVSLSPFVRSVQFLDADTIVVTYLGAVGVKVLKISSCEKIQDLAPPTQFEFYGSAALSPSGRRLAVTNLGLGVDWFSFSHGRFMSTSHYPTQGRSTGSLITHLKFIDEDTVVVGHCAGTLTFVTFGMSHNPFTLAVGTAPIQTLACAILDNNEDPVVLAILQGRNAPTKIAIIDIKLSVIKLNARHGSTSLPEMPGALNSRSPATLNGSPGLTSFNIKLTAAIVVLAVAISIVARLGDYQYGEVIPRVRLGCPPWKSDCGKPRVALPHRLGTRSRLRTEVASSVKTVYATTTVTARPPSRTDMFTTTVTEQSTVRGYTTTVTARPPTSTELVTVFDTATTTSIVTAPAPTTACHCPTNTIVTTTDATANLPSMCLCTFSGTISMDRASPLPIVFEVEQVIENVGKEVVTYSDV
ncbi:hypothetical protein HYPSUDRAFT_209009 [Hypholoma sublateritium FD-334 SS-4]|uniref:Uncharacterized protein n=1 Tax=Hypholoma sublateritium (strain FD-334 SS-4) TaxID=945553 RepID=A0A0D2P092_HYPSF|nr:hypothetical protein HYPSUDRAFT_209009 [Hypholoma sublateritium FD-334 SS-4]